MHLSTHNTHVRTHVYAFARTRCFHVEPQKPSLDYLERTLKLSMLAEALSFVKISQGSQLCQN